MATLELLLTMDKEMYKALSDRLASGITMLLKANLVYMHDFRDWEVLLGILENVVEYINSRSACWESVTVLAEGGHLKDDNFAPWMSLCCGFVRHRTSYAVDALKLLQGLANSDNTYKMNGSSWLQVMQVMLNYLNDDRPPVAKTAWDCLRNSLLLPGVPIAKDTWKKCFNDIIFAFDDQVNDITVKMARDAPLYSVTLLSKTFLHNLNVLMELPDFPELWLKVLRRLAKKLVASSSPTMRSQQSSVVFETTLQSLYNLLLVLKAEDVLERGSTEGSSETLFDETRAVIDAVCPHLKEQLGLLPENVAVEMPATDGSEHSEQPTAEAIDEVGAVETSGEEAEGVVEHQTTHEEETEATVEAVTEAGATKDEEIAADEETLARLMPEVEGQVEVAPVDEPMSHHESIHEESVVSTSSGPPTSTTTLETVIIGDGTFGIKVDEVIVDEITEAV
ncbi:hypothetical protein L917_12206 [Phytophthora nicotianae]|nr:hypothetical protein L917_12206 [Phytophthora nicotianae]